MVKIKTKQNNNEEDKIVIGKEWTGREDNPIFICEWCSCTLSRLIDSSGENPSLYCSGCQMSFNPQYDNLRHVPKITTQHEDTEPSISIVNVDLSKEVEIRHTPELRGSFAQLAKKGTIKFTSYSTTEKE